MQEQGPLRIGQTVRVEWTDGLVYTSKVLGLKMAAVYQVPRGVCLVLHFSCHPVFMYPPPQVRLNDGSKETALESDFV